MIKGGRYDSAKAAVTGASQLATGTGSLSVQVTLDTGQDGFCTGPGLALLQRSPQTIDSGTETLSWPVPSHFS